MKDPYYVWRGLLSLFVTLPLCFIAAAFVTGVLASTVVKGVVGNSPTAGALLILPAGLFLLFCAWRGARFAWRHQVDYVDQGIFVRYAPLIIAATYTSIVALIAAYLPYSEAGGVYSRFNVIFGFLHFFTAVPVTIAFIFESAPPWAYVVVPVSIYAAFWLGMAYGYWNLGSTRREWLLSAALLLGFLSLGALTTRELVSMRKDVLSPNSSKTQPPPFIGEMDRLELEAYRPLEKNSRLVKLTAPGLQISSDHPRWDGSTALFPVYAAAVQAIYQNVNAYALRQLVESKKTPIAYQNLIAGKVDLIMATPPSPAQLSKAKEAGITLHTTPIAREAFVFFVHKDNPVSTLTEAQIQAIYRKEITNWKEVGGADQPILPFQRPKDSGSQTTFMSKVMKTKAPAAPLQQERILGMGGVIREVAAYQNSERAIGYSFRYYLTSMNGTPDVKMLSINGIAPTREAIRDGSYPFTSEFVLVTAGSKNPHVKPLIDWFLSPKGQALIEEVGYVGITPSHP